MKQRSIYICFHFFLKLILINVDIEYKAKLTKYLNGYNMASYREETNFSMEVIPFLLNREDYVGFFLKIDPKEHNFMTFILKRKDFNSQSEFMRNLAIIYDSLAK